MISRVTQTFFALSLAFFLSLPQLAVAKDSDPVVIEEPTALAMTGDLLVVRPVMMAITAVGTAVFILSSPFALLGGNLGEAADTLVVKPAKTTFVRCLGCTKPGYKPKVVVAEEVSE